MRVAWVGNAAFVCAVLTFGLSGCSSIDVERKYSPVGSSVGPLPLSRDHPSPFLNPRPRSVAIGLACSGGGSRAAYLTAAVLREIRRTGLAVTLPNDAARQAHLLDQIDFVSAVSGGALSAAYFVARIHDLKHSTDSQEWDEYLGRMAMNYRQRQWYAYGLLNPLSWARTLFTNFNRGHIARDDYHDQLYRGNTLADLPERPVLYVNAFDVGNRVRFVFSRHFIDTGYYQPKGWTNRLNEPQDITSENDLVFSRVDPGSVRLADAVYASSAFPFVYPNLALNHFGSKIPFQGRYLFLADGGLADNSGLLTLLTQMKAEAERSKTTRLVLGIYIDASIDAIGPGTVFQRRGVEDEYAWRDTYLGHGRGAVEAGFDHHEDAVFRFLDSTGVLLDELILNYRLKLVEAPFGRSSSRASWDDMVRSGQLLLRPLVIGLRLRHISDAYYAVWTRYKNASPSERLRLVELFEASGIPSGLEEGRDAWPAETFRGLAQRISDVKTDFVLEDGARRVLDLVAYLLVHGKLVPALNEWNAVVSSRAVAH